MVSVAAGPGEADLLSSCIHVELFAADGSLPEARIQALDLDGGAAQEIHVTLPWSGTIDIVPEKFGAIEISADGYWSPALVWAGKRDLAATLIPTGVLWGRITTSSEDPLPDALLATFRSVVAESGQAGPSTEAVMEAFEIEGQLKCPIANRIWECDLPEGRLDLSLHVARHAPIYLWDTVVEKKSRQQISPLSLIPGASLAGWIATDHAASAESLAAQVEIRPLQLVLAQGTTERRRSELLAVSVKSDKRGFFQATGLAPGTYAVRATKGELRSAEMEVAVPRSDQQVELEEPILLLPMARLEVQVEPTVDPWNHPWLIELLRSEGRRANRYLTLEKSLASPAGHWRKEKLELGSYRLVISDSQGSTWVADKVEVFADMDPLFYVVDVIPVRGTLEWAGEGLEGEVIFGTAHGAMSLRMRSDAEGHFEGSLPYEGEWPLEIVINGASGTHALEPVVVRKRPGKSYAEVQIELPNTALRGKVVQDGKPVAGAIVLGLRHYDVSTSRSLKSADVQEMIVSQMPFRREFDIVSGKDGTFESLGLSPGEIQVQAYTPDAASEWVTTNLVEDSPSPEVVLALSEMITIRGRLINGSGGVPGARIFTTPSEGIIPDTQSDVRGYFHIDLQKSCNHVDLLVVPPGAGVVLHRILLHGEDVEDILVATSETGSIVIKDSNQPSYLPRYPLYVRFAGAQVSTSLLNRWMSYHEEGGYVLDDVTPGVWSLCPESTSPEDLCSKGEVFAGSETILVVPAKTGGNR